MKTVEKTITAAEFKAKCLKILDQLGKAKCLKILDQLGPEGIVATKRGQPVARVTPVHPVDNRRLIGSMKGKVIVPGDIFSTGVKWDTEAYIHRHAKSTQGRT